MFYQAYLKAKAKFLEIPDSPKPKQVILNVRFAPKAKAFSVLAKRGFKRDLRKGKFKLGEWHYVGLWPRTDKSGNLIEGTIVPRALLEKGFTELGIVVGDFTEVDTERGVVVVQINPNKKGHLDLRESFFVTLKASDKVIHACKKFDKGQPISVDSHLDGKTLDLHAKDVMAGCFPILGGKTIPK